MSLKAAALGSVKWTTASFAAVFGAQFVQAMILARVLAPAEFGQVALITLLIAFTEIFLGFGLTQAVIQRRAVSSRELSSVYWLNVFWSVVLAALVYAMSGPIAQFFSTPTAAPLIRLCSLVFIIGALSQLNLAVLERRLLFRVIAIAEVCAISAGFATTMTLAFTGFGAASAVWGLLVTYTVKLIAYRVAARRYFRLRFRLRFHEAAPFLGFGLFQTLDTLCNYASANISSLATGRILGPGTLGGYNFLYSTVVNTPAKINPILTRVMLPIFSRVQHDHERIGSGFLTTTAVAGFISIPPLVGIAFVGEPLVVVLMGERWSWLAPLVPLLCIVGIFRAVGNPVGSLLMSTNNVRLGLAVNVIKTSVTVPLVIVATLIWGVQGAAGGLAVTAVSGFFIAFATVRRVIRIRFLDYVIANFTSLVVSVPMAVVVVIAGALIPSEWPALLRLVVSMILGLAAFVLTVSTSRAERVLEFRSLVLSQVPKRLRSSRPAPLAVLIPPVEPFDGTGGAVATWVREVYRRSPIPYTVFGPTAGGDFSAGMSVAPVTLYRAIRGGVLFAARLAAPLVRKSPRSIHDFVLGSGRVYLWALWPALRETRTIHLHNRPQAALWLRARGFRGELVLHMHNDLADYVTPDSVDARGILVAVDRVLFCSEYLRAKGVADFGLDDAKTAVLYNGVDPGDRGETDQRRRSTLVFAGRLIPEKGAADAIEACRMLRERGADVRLDIFGGGIGSDATKTPYWANVEAAAAVINEAHGASTVTVHGPVPHSRLLDEIARAGVFVYPVRWEEPFGMVIVESLAVGTPVVSFARGGIPEILDESSGVLVPPLRGLTALVDAVEQLIDDPGYAAISRAARVRAGEFGWDRVADDTFRILGDEEPVPKGT